MNQTKVVHEQAQQVNQTISSNSPQSRVEEKTSTEKA
jgi:hypothetical protein